MEYSGRENREKRKEQERSPYSMPRQSMACARFFQFENFFSQRVPALDPVEFYRELWLSPYWSAPQTWQTDAQRLIRDRHRRHILNRLRHHMNEEASAAKTRRMKFGSIASHLFPARPQHNEF